MPSERVTILYEQALFGTALVVPDRGQWAVYTYVEFADDIRIGYVRTFIHQHVAEFAAKVITAAMNRTDLRAKGPINY